jgi:hypothetical protein
MSIFSFNSNSKNFEKRKPWWFEIDGTRVSWEPRMPYLFSESDQGQLIVEQIMNHLERWTGEWIQATPTGPSLIADISNPHTTLFIVNELFEGVIFFDEDDEDDGANSPRVKYSKTAPKLSAIFGASHDEFGNEIIY